MAKKNNYSRNIERLLLACVTAIILLMCVKYFFNIRQGLEDTENGYKNGSIVNLNSKFNKDTLTKIFTKGGYFTDAKYIGFVVNNIHKKLSAQHPLPNLGAMNKSGFMIDAGEFEKTGTESGELRFLNSLAHLGMDSAMYRQENKNPKPYAATIPVQAKTTGIKISGSINYDENIAKPVSKKGILVKLNEIFPDDYFDSLQDNAKPLITAFYARTDDNGYYEFVNCKKNSNYSVIAIKPGFEFGRSKGQAAIAGNRQFNFTARPHRLRILDGTEYRQIKNDKVVTVRTPAGFTNEFATYIGFFILSFWIFHIVISVKNYRSDQFILPLLMFITGIGIIVLYSIQDPLRDEIYGSGMAGYSGLVLLIFSAIALIVKNNPVNRFYHSQWFDPVAHILPGNKLKAPRGYTWLLLSIGLMLLLLFFGTGPEGSGVKVNLLGFQVSEPAKFFMIVFFAAYFAVYAAYFRNIPDNRWLTKNNMLMFVLFILLLGVYATLGDLGPAIVLCVTFLFFYAFAKEEFFKMILAAIIYAALLFTVSKITKNSGHNYLPWVALIACIGTFFYAFISKRYESVFFIILLLSSFVLLAVFPFEFTQRLTDRNSMFGNIWENKFIGGDQLAQGVWSLNSGGFLGQGLGKGMSNTMPAYHTDMILQSIGEEIGIAALVAVFLAFGLLFYRSILAARRTGKAFMFYLMSGIAIATMVQFIVIVAGTLDLIPLTGISVPFLSKGNAGIIVTMFAFILLLLMSNEKGDALEMEYIKKNFDNVNASAILTFFAAILVFAGTLFWYQIKSNEYIVKPALVLNRQGEWQYSYNPRIALMIREIKAGNIYDKNGILLATSDKNTFNAFKDRLVKSGANAALYNEQLTRNQKRYYPFGANLLFWLGDYNKEIAKEQNNGYAAEYRHYTMLRGFDVKYTTTQRTSDRYKENRFLPEREKQSELLLYDYSTLAPFIKAGKNSNLIKEQNKKAKDIQLSIDVLLNEKINSVIQQNTAIKNFRTSIVAIDAKTGGVLASASNPAPSYKDLKLISNIDPLEYKDIFKQLFNDRVIVNQDLGITYNSRPGSTVKIIDAYAAINKFGLAATNFSYFIFPGEVIHTGEPVNETVDMRKAIVRSSNVYFIKLANEKNLEAALFNLYDALGMNIMNRGGFHFQQPENYERDEYFKEWNKFLAKGKGIYNSKRLQGSRKRFESNYSNIAWGQGELMATPLHLARMAGNIAKNGILESSKFLLKSWSSPIVLQQGVQLYKNAGTDNTLSSFMKEQSAKVAAGTGLDVRGKTGSPERDKLIKKGNTTIRKRVTDSWYTFFVPSPKMGAPIAFTIRIEEIGNSEYAKELAKDILNELKTAGYF